ncbi:hypothetical protein BU204_36355 [Actinophytocola xanthii]|uniref:YbaB/EbfC DNA-binding family protein n=1 Tax=Actinophytocola xanthii TaxID=1912961 RepID=A0A1Q8BWD5_9PSEU|nr:hypothetical protein BU204_36355 [Actinophytocola xanthii]
MAQDAARFQRLRTEIASIRIVESSSDGTIRVTVDATGAVVDIATGGRLASLRPQEIGGRIMAVVARAQGRIAEEVRQAAHATLGPDASAAAPVWEQSRSRFGGPSLAPSPAAAPQRGPGPGPGFRPGPGPGPRARRRTEDELWADEPILRPATESRRDRS